MHGSPDVSLLAYVRRHIAFRRRVQRRAVQLLPGRYRMRTNRAVLVGAMHPDWLDPPTLPGDALGVIKERVASLASFTIDAVPRPRDARQPAFAGSLALLTRNEHIKFFDLDRGLVLSIVRDGERASVGHRHLPAPEVRYIAPNETSWVETFVAGRPVHDAVPDDRERALHWLIEAHVDHVLRSRSTGPPDGTVLTGSELMERAQSVPEFTGLVARMHRALSEFSVSVPRVASHGDACLKNLLWTSDGWRLLDWEYAGRYSVLFDAFTGVLVEAIDRRDDRWLRLYLDGAYDAAIRALDPLAGSDIGPRRRAAYLAFVVGERVVRRDLKRAPAERSSAAGRYLRALGPYLDPSGTP